MPDLDVNNLPEKEENSNKPEGSKVKVIHMKPRGGMLENIILGADNTGIKILELSDKSGISSELSYQFTSTAVKNRDLDKNCEVFRVGNYEISEEDRYTKTERDAIRSEIRKAVEKFKEIRTGSYEGQVAGINIAITSDNVDQPISKLKLIYVADGKIPDTHFLSIVEKELAQSSKEITQHYVHYNESSKEYRDELLKTSEKFHLDKPQAERIRLANEAAKYIYVEKVRNLETNFSLSSSLDSIRSKQEFEKKSVTIHYNKPQYDKDGNYEHGHANLITIDNTKEKTEIRIFDPQGLPLNSHDMRKIAKKFPQADVFYYTFDKETNEVKKTPATEAVAFQDSNGNTLTIKQLQDPALFPDLFSDLASKLAEKKEKYPDLADNDQKLYEKIIDEDFAPVRQQELLQIQPHEQNYDCAYLSVLMAPLVAQDKVELMNGGDFYEQEINSGLKKSAAMARRLIVNGKSEDEIDHDLYAKNRANIAIEGAENGIRVHIDPKSAMYRHAQATGKLVEYDKNEPANLNINKNGDWYGIWPGAEQYNLAKRTNLEKDFEKFEESLKNLKEGWDKSRAVFNYIFADSFLGFFGEEYAHKLSQGDKSFLANILSSVTIATTGATVMAADKIHDRVRPEKTTTKEYSVATKPEEIQKAAQGLKRVRGSEANHSNKSPDAPSPSKKPKSNERGA